MSKHTFECVDGHTCGNPVRLVKSGAPQLIGKSMSEKRQEFLANHDWIRTGLMFEPRGHDMMSGAFLYPPHDTNNDFAILFIETSGCLPMCGHGAIGAITLALEEGLVTPKRDGRIRMEAPAGLIDVAYSMVEGKVQWVELTNVKSYLAAAGLKVMHSVLGELTFDVAYGGNFYAIVDPQSAFKGVECYTASELISWSRELRSTINATYPGAFVHPEDSTIRDVTHIMWTGAPMYEDSHGRNAVFYGEKAIDRSPCGTGTSARMAQWHAKGMLGVNQPFIHESYIGSTFTGHIAEETTIGDKFAAIVPKIRGWAKRYGHNTIWIDAEEDPFAHGFQVI